MSDAEKAVDATLDLASENQRLRERVAELENLAGQNAEWAEEARDRALKAEAERDAALAQVAVLRGALKLTRDQLTTRGQAFDFAEFREKHALHFIDETLASTPVPEHDYSGLCAAPSCEGHCGYVHARGCEAVREYLADHGGKPYRAPRPPDILRRVAERVREACAKASGKGLARANIGTIDLDAIIKEATRD